MFCFLGIFDIVAVGGSVNVRILRDDYNYVLVVFKFFLMIFRFLDKLFFKETLFRFIFYGIKEFVVFDLSRIFVIKSRLSK